jgi:glycosyltransferase involved in cell wall biosynthesis
MNFMAYGLPVLAAVNPAGEVARIVGDSNAGWVVDSGDAESFPRAVAAVSRARAELAGRGEAARRYAELHFTPRRFAARFDLTLQSVAGS